MSSYEGLCPDCQQIECDEACMKATSSVELLPLPDGWNARILNEWARACVEANTEALRAEVEQAKGRAAENLQRAADAETRAERLEETLRQKAETWEIEGIRLNGGADKPYTDDENSIRAFVLGCCCDELKTILRDIASAALEQEASRG